MWVYAYMYTPSKPMPTGSKFSKVCIILIVHSKCNTELNFENSKECSRTSAGNNSQKSALYLLYIVNVVPSWILRISSLRHQCPQARNFQDANWSDASKVGPLLSYYSIVVTFASTSSYSADFGGFI